MSQRVASRSVVVLNSQGLHARPADMLVKLASEFDADIEIVKNGEHVNGKSILSVITLAAEQGTQLSITANGSDAEDAVAALAELFGRAFDECDPAAEACGDEQSE